MENNVNALTSLARCTAQAQAKARQSNVASLVTNQRYSDIQPLLARICDIERILARIALKTAKPRDLAQLRHALDAIPTIRQTLLNTQTAELTALAEPLTYHSPMLVDGFATLATLLHQAIVDSPPATIREGGMIAKGYDETLDKLLALSENANQFLVDLENRERERTQLSTLKVAYNRVHGYYIELSRTQSNQAPNDYTRRQTLKNVERFITPTLKEFEERILSSRSRTLAREKQLYNELLDKLLAHLPALQRLARTLAELDVFANLAERAITLNLTQPEVLTKPGIFIKDGRHPVIEQTSNMPFVPNDIHLNPQEQRMLIITGPNMGGKSTYMRQTALIVLLAHIGSFVPASSARLGCVDRIFTRIGASDDLASGRSTFMVEMTETANILHNATKNSLVLMDEIGRGHKHI